MLNNNKMNSGGPPPPVLIPEANPDMYNAQGRIKGSDLDVDCRGRDSPNAGDTLAACVQARLEYEARAAAAAHAASEVGKAERNRLLAGLAGDGKGWIPARAAAAAAAAAPTTFFGRLWNSLKRKVRRARNFVRQSRFGSKLANIRNSILNKLDPKYAFQRASLRTINNESNVNREARFNIARRRTLRYYNEHRGHLRALQKRITGTNANSKRMLKEIEQKIKESNTPTYLTKQGPLDEQSIRKYNANITRFTTQSLLTRKLRTLRIYAIAEYNIIYQKMPWIAREALRELWSFVQYEEEKLINTAIIGRLIRNPLKFLVDDVIKRFASAAANLVFRGNYQPIARIVAPCALFLVLPLPAQIAMGTFYLLVALRAVYKTTSLRENFSGVTSIGGGQSRGAILDEATRAKIFTAICAFKTKEQREGLKEELIKKFNNGGTDTGMIEIIKSLFNEAENGNNSEVKVINDAASKLEEAAKDFADKNGMKKIPGNLTSKELAAAVAATALPKTEVTVENGGRSERRTRRRS